MKRAIRALQSPAYEKARKKNPALPEVSDRASLENAFKLLPMSMLALRVVKIDPKTLPNPPKKHIKGLWNVKIEGQQDASDDMYYAWLYEGSQVKRKVYALLALALVFTIVLYPLWPLAMRQGVYYLSWGFMWLLAAFFAMAIFRVILFGVSYLVSPGFWLFPNLWEDVSFLDSFRPVWAWHEVSQHGRQKAHYVSLTIAPRLQQRRRRRRAASRPLLAHNQLSEPFLASHHPQPPQPLLPIPR